jgi:hypothetical protein
MLGDEMCAVRVSLYLHVFPVLVPKDIVFDINTIVSVHSIYEFILKRAAFPEEAHVNLNIPPYGNVYYGKIFLPFDFFCLPELIAVTTSAFISTSSFTCYNSLFRSPLILQAIVHGCCRFHLALLITLVVLWLFLWKSMRITGVSILQGSLSTLNSTQSFENEGPIRIMLSL